MELGDNLDNIKETIVINLNLQILLEQGDKSPFAKGGFRGECKDHLIYIHNPTKHAKTTIEYKLKNIVINLNLQVL